MTEKWSAIRRPMTPERRARVDAMKRAMDDAAMLTELRTAQGVTQVELASRLGIRQASVSEMERRDDVYLSTLRDYIEALGGELEIAAVFPEQRVLLHIGQRQAAAPPR